MITRKPGNTDRWIMCGDTTSLAPTITNTDQFWWYGSTAFSITENQRQPPMPVKCTLTLLMIQVNGNNLDAMSTNTWTIKKEGTDTTMIVTIESTAGTGAFFVTGNILFEQGDLISLRWDSDSVGSFGWRGLSVSGVIIG